MSFLGKKWLIKNQNKGLNLIDKMLENRHLKTDEQVYSFFNYSLNRLHDPLLLKDMEKAVGRLKEAVKNQEKIMIFGDYDVDGTSATALLYDLFQKIGANVQYFLPDREKDGYGLKDRFIHQFKKENVDIIITVDCGTANIKEVELANQLGITTIITDHHNCPSELPPAYALINPRQSDCEYPNKELSGSAVAYKLVCALAPYYFSDSELEDYLYKQMGLAVLGLVADCMKLTGENRVLTANGLKSLSDGSQPGVSALLEEAEMEDTQITSGTIAYFIGPRINAAGRLESAHHALELLLGNTDKAKTLAELNLKRRAIMVDFLDETIAQIETLAEIPPILVVSSEKWNAGVLGLIAGRLCERFNRPAIAMQEKGEELVGSCRSLNNFDITNFLRTEANELFINVGGHMLAGGFSMPKKNLPELEKRIREKAPQYIDLPNFHGSLELEGEVHPDDLSVETSIKIKKFEPFGVGNPEPTLLLKNIQIPTIKAVGKIGEHLQFPIKQGDKTFPAIAFRFGEHLEKISTQKNYDVAFNLEVNEWQGNQRLQLKVVDLKEAE